jgi:GTPase
MMSDTTINTEYTPEIPSPAAVRIPLVALVGRPNVGKSTLFNRITGRRTALVYDQPGVTRDRIFGEARIGDKVVKVVDTGGLDPRSDDVLLGAMQAQTQLAIDEADLVLLVVDSQYGVNPLDFDISQMLRRAGKPTVVIANKVDTGTHESRIHEFYELGLPEVLGVSAEHGRGIEPLEEYLTENLILPDKVVVDNSRSAIPVSEEDLPVGGISRVEWKGGPIHVAVIGRPNAGKSSLVNRVLGEERHLASEVPGTTRDAIDSEVEREGQPYVFIDTAGVRRKRSIGERLEQIAVVQAFNSMDRADITLMVLDGTVAPTEQDAKIAAMAHEKGRGLILVINKWDLVENQEWRDLYMEQVRITLKFAPYAPVVRLSAKTGRGLDLLFREIVSVQQERHRRVGTGELNRFFDQVVGNHPPPIRGGKRPRLYFVSQPLVRPPTFVFAAHRISDLHFSYIRYLSNSLRERYGFGGTPIWLKFRPRKDRHKDNPS